MEIARVFGSGWSLKTGKSFLGDKKVRVGFTVPQRNGEFTRQCVSGCINLRIRVTDGETHRLLPQALVTLTAKVGGTPITKFSRDGVFCRADGTADIASGCSPTLKVALDHKRDLDVYYWAPGVVDPTKIEITAEVTAAAYPKDGKDAATVTATKNVAFFKRVKLTNTAIRNLNVMAPVVFGLGWADLADYCAVPLRRPCWR